MATKREDFKQIGELEEDLLNKIDAYIKLINKNNPNKPKLKRIHLIRDYFLKLLEDKTLNNDFITLDTPFYFDKEKLYINNTVKATTKPPIINKGSFIKIKAIPNNLDTFNKEFNTYCYNEENKHYGIDVLLMPSNELLKYDTDNLNILLEETEELEKRLIPYYITFEYDKEKNNLKINLIDPVYIEENIKIKEYPEEFEKVERKLNKAYNNKQSLEYSHKPYLTDLGLKKAITPIYNNIKNYSLDYAKFNLNLHDLLKNDIIKKYIELQNKQVSLEYELEEIQLNFNASESPEEMAYFENEEIKLNDAINKIGNTIISIYDDNMDLIEHYENLIKLKVGRKKNIIRLYYTLHRVLLFQNDNYVFNKEFEEYIDYSKFYISDVLKDILINYFSEDALIYIKLINESSNIDDADLIKYSKEIIELNN